MKKSPVKKRPRSTKKKPLPKTFRGASVVRGLGMNDDELVELVEREALDNFDATRDTFLVVRDRVLAEGVGDDYADVRGFRDEASAIRFAQAQANGNVDQRVLRVTGQTLVVATMNEL